jgi:hypothetical protein
MNRETYEQLKEQYIYSISKNGLISTKAIDKKSYLFRSEDDKTFKTFLFKIGETNKRFLMMVLREARGMEIIFADEIPDAPVPDVVLESLPEPEPIPDIQMEIQAIKEQLQKDDPDTELITPLYLGNVHEGDLIPSWWK